MTINWSTSSVLDRIEGAKGGFQSSPIFPLSAATIYTLQATLEIAASFRLNDRGAIWPPVTQPP
ncbi:GH23237 [Drosophila grimshawi]|uniref:GH23237 n=1 Tax=Drosophila grimshawi TaxID=7222 RepID=B4K418_DROGR|nr:GH23237 [Drosophila grimshawi]